MYEGIHEFGSLAGAEIHHPGQMAADRFSREIPLARSRMPVATYDSVQARAMDLSDIQNFRKWHRNAALRVKRAGFGIVYVYAGHQLSTISHFVSLYRNRRADAYGSSLENRARLLREILQDTKEAI